MLVLSLTCASGPEAEPPKPPATTPATQERAAVIELEETTVTRIGRTRVPLGGMLVEGTYEVDGAEKTGPTGQLVLPDGARRVGLGSTVEIEGTTYEVTAIHKEAGSNGTLALTAR